MSESQPDPVTAYLEDAARRYEVFGESDAMPRLLAAVEAALGCHVQAVHYTDEGTAPPFRYCRTCSGHPAWPCPEVQAISRALLGDTP